MYKNNIKHLQLLKCVQYSAGGSLEVMMLRLCDRYVYRLTLAFYIWCLYLHIKITKVVFISEDYLAEQILFLLREQCILVSL